MSDTGLELTEGINGNSEQVNAITEAGELRALGAVSALRMALTVDHTTAIINEHNIGNGGSSIDLSFVTATAGDILAGKVGADADGNPVNGTIPTVTPSKSSNKVTVPAGYIATEQILTVGTAKSAKTYTPGTSNQTIAANTYLTGKQTIKGDANLLAENIKSGVTIFNVAGTFEGTGGGGTGGSGTFDLAKVTEYTPARPAMTSVTSVEVSGLHDLIWSDDPDDEDYEYNEYYSEANGTYNVTPETASEADWQKRIYKHESEEYYLYYEYYDDYPDESTWFLSTTPDSDGQFIRKYNEWDWDTDEPLPVGDLESGTSEWGDYDWEPHEVTLEVYTVATPDTPMVLKGVLATAYTDGEWSFASTEQSFTGFEETPKAGFIYAAAGDRLVGSSIGCPYPMLLMPLNGNLSATSYGVNITPTVNGTLTFDSHGAKFTGDQYIDLPIDVGFFAKNATICFKIYQTGSGRYGYVAGTKDRYLGVDNNYGVFCLWAGMGDAWRIVDSDGVTGRSDVEVPQNTEVHVAYVHNAITHKYLLYIHGELVKELDNADVISGGVDLRFGAWGNGDYRFVGSMRDIRVYDKALSAEELATIANS